MCIKLNKIHVFQDWLELHELYENALVARCLPYFISPLRTNNASYGKLKHQQLFPRFRVLISAKRSEKACRCTVMPLPVRLGVQLTYILTPVF